MKYRDKTLPIREAVFYDVKACGYSSVRLTISYDTESKDIATQVRQPLQISLCEMKWLCVEFHRVLNELEDELRVAREEMKGTRQVKAITAAGYEWGADKLREGEDNPF